MINKGVLKNGISKADRKQKKREKIHRRGQTDKGADR